MPRAKPDGPDGHEGLKRFAEMPEGYFDMILMDIQMPVMNGLDARNILRNGKP